MQSASEPDVLPARKKIIAQTAAAIIVYQRKGEQSLRSEEEDRKPRFLPLLLSPIAYIAFPFRNFEGITQRNDPSSSDRILRPGQT